MLPEPTPSMIKAAIAVLDEWARTNFDPLDDSNAMEDAEAVLRLWRAMYAAQKQDQITP